MDAGVGQISTAFTKDLLHITSFKNEFMLSGSERTWLHYVNDIIAADVYSAVFLATYMRYNAINKKYIKALEVIDLQKYKIIRQPNKVRIAIKDRADIPFIFIIGKN